MHSPFQAAHKFPVGPGLGSSCTIPEHWSSFGEAIASLIYMQALACCHAGEILLCDAWSPCAKIDWYSELFVIPSSLINAPVPAEEKLPQRTMLPSLCFTVALVFFWWWAVIFLHQTFLLELWPNKILQFWSHQIIILYGLWILFHMVGTWIYLLPNFGRTWMFYFE